MKSLARLILLFCITLLIVSSSVAAASYFYQWIHSAGSIPPGKIIPLLGLIEAFVRSMPFAFYTTMVASLGYTVRRGIPAAVAYIALPVLAVLVLGALHWGADALLPLSTASPAHVSPSLVSQGLLIATRDGMVVQVGNTPESPTFVFADGRTDGHPQVAGLPLAPPIPGALGPILRDFTNAAGIQQALWKEGPASFALHIGALAFMLASLRFFFGLTAWPLANTLFGMLLFRWVLSFDVLVHSEGFLRYAAQIIPDRVPEAFLPAAVMLAAGLLMILQTFLSFLASERNKHHG